MSNKYIRFNSMSYQDFEYTTGNTQQVITGNTISTTSTLTFNVGYFLSEDKIRWYSNTAVLSVQTTSTGTDVDIQNAFLEQLQGLRNGYIVG
jgi:hypothetical protein